MSTILNALKRAEQNCPDRISENNPSIVFNARKTFNSRMLRQQRLTLKGGVIIVVAFGILGSLIYFMSKSMLFEMGSPSNRVSKTELVKNEKTIEEYITEPDSPSLVPQVNKRQHAEKKTSSFNDTIVNNIENLNLPPFEEKQLGKDEVFAKAKSEIETTDKMVISSTGTKTISIPPIVTKYPDKPADKEIIPLEEDMLKIQAISWADDPSDRIVVINDKVLGEGESVEGYIIKKIQKDQVILNQSGQVYELGFKYR